MPIERSDVYWVNFDPSLGGEIRKTRPAIILSNNAANAALNRVQVVPVTSKADRIYPGEALINLQGEKRKAMADQLTTVSKQRLGSKLGTIGLADMARVEAAVAVQLALNLK
ncbi:MAG TPA: type II toxin-antitoxin system PemK/MazF family toxin [Terracidiphilus sp.]|jgi:mRNA interferase MazF|nr:type II toxin-antitoxin system PemK/MazF family toxin [Terracidiphilus sp.]